MKQSAAPCRPPIVLGMLTAWNRTAAHRNASVPPYVPRPRQSPPTEFAGLGFAFRQSRRKVSFA